MPRLSPVRAEPDTADGGCNVRLRIVGYDCRLDSSICGRHACDDPDHGPALVALDDAKNWRGLGKLMGTGNPDADGASCLQIGRAHV